MKLGLVAASPMYYQAPLYRLLARAPNVTFTALFSSSGGPKPRSAGFGKPIQWDVDILSGYDYGFLRKADVNPIGGGLFSLLDWDVLAEVADRQFDVLWVHGYNVMTNLLAVLRQRARGGGVVLREEQTLLAPRAPWKQLVKRLALPVLFGGATAVYIGTENRRWLSRFGFREDRLFFSPYCVDAERLVATAASAPPVQELRREFGLPDDGRPVILSVSRLAEAKQPLELLDAFVRVRRTAPCALLVVGSGELEEAMRAKVARERIPDVRFAGFVNQSSIARAYSVADIFVLFSRYEPWGVVVNEAMHLGLPVVASSRVGSAVDLVLDGVTGYRVRFDDVGTLAKRVAALVGDRELRGRMGAAARHHASEWNYERAAAGVVAAARAAMERGR